jgi:hypothetical protein
MEADLCNAWLLGIPNHGLNPKAMSTQDTKTDDNG